MKIAIDARVLEKKVTGVGRYLFSILKELPNYDKRNKYLLLSKSKINIQNDYYSKYETGTSLLPEKLHSPYWLNFILPKYLEMNKIELFFTPNHLLPLNKLKGVKSIIAVHDVFHRIDHKFHPVSYNMYLDLFLPNSLAKSDAIIAVSNSSKKDIIRIFNVPEQKIHVIYEHADETFRPIMIDNGTRDTILERLNLPRNKFILYVGLIENRKNILGILKVGDILQKKKINISIVLIGRQGYGFERIYNEIEKRSHYVKYLNYVDDDSLKKIYNMASFFLFPSYYEGFGLPPLEAMQCGIPVLVSNRSSLIEVVGKGGILHDPDNHEAFASDIETLYNDVELYKEAQQKALLQSREFHKEKSTKELIKVFNSI